MSKHIQGPVIPEETATNCIDIMDAQGMTFANVMAPDDGDFLSDEDRANAALIVEAFNVATETGMTPRQLADDRQTWIERHARESATLDAAEIQIEDLMKQRAELLAALKIADELLGCTVAEEEANKPEFKADRARIRVAIAKVEAGQ